MIVGDGGEQVEVAVDAVEAGGLIGVGVDLLHLVGAADHPVDGLELDGAGVGAHGALRDAEGLRLLEQAQQRDGPGLDALPDPLGERGVLLQAPGGQCPAVAADADDTRIGTHGVVEGARIGLPEALHQGGSGERLALDGQQRGRPVLCRAGPGEQVVAVDGDLPGQARGQDLLIDAQVVRHRRQRRDTELVGEVGECLGEVVVEPGALEPVTTDLPGVGEPGQHVEHGVECGQVAQQISYGGQGAIALRQGVEHEVEGVVGFDEAALEPGLQLADALAGDAVVSADLLEGAGAHDAAGVDVPVTRVAADAAADLAAHPADGVRGGVGPVGVARQGVQGAAHRGGNLRRELGLRVGQGQPFGEGLDLTGDAAAGLGVVEVDVLGGHGQVVAGRGVESRVDDRHDGAVDAEAAEAGDVGELGGGGVERTRIEVEPAGDDGTGARQGVRDLGRVEARREFVEGHRAVALQPGLRDVVGSGRLHPEGGEPGEHGGEIGGVLRLRLPHGDEFAEHAGEGRLVDDGHPVVAGLARLAAHGVRVGGDEHDAAAGDTTDVEAGGAGALLPGVATQRQRAGEGDPVTGLETVVLDLPVDRFSEQLVDRGGADGQLHRDVVEVGALHGGDHPVGPRLDGELTDVVEVDVHDLLAAEAQCLRLGDELLDLTE